MTQLTPRIKRSAVFLAIVLVAMVAGLFAAPLIFGHDDHSSGSLRAGAGTTPHHFSLGAAQAGAGGEASLVARAHGRRVAVYRSPRSPRPYRTIKARTLNGRRLPLVFLVKGRRHGWLNVHLPTRPNLSTGFIRTRDVSLATNEYRVAIQLRRHRLIVKRGARTVAREPIAVGKSLSPTPTGRYYVTDLIRPPDPRGFYGPYAFGLSAHSKVFTTFEGGDGQVGIHGTNVPGAIGHDVSHGCIRVRNRVIRRLAKELPLGSPVTISR